MPGNSETLPATHHQAVFTLDRQLCFTAFNRAHVDNMKAVYGTKVDLGGRFADYITVAADREATVADLRRALAGERRVISANRGEPGHERHFDVVYEPSINGAGEVVGVTGHAYDVTEQRVIETDLLTNEGRFRQLFEASPDGVVVIGLDGRIAASNNVQARMYGYESPNDLVGLLATVLVAPSSRDYSAQNMRRRLKGEKIPAVEYELLRKDGTTFPGETMGMTIRNSDGTVSGYICTTRDTTERRRANAALRESEKRYRELYNGAIEGIYRTSLEGRSLGVNEAGAQMLGYESAASFMDECVDSAHQVWANPDERSLFIERLLEQGIVRDYETQFLRKDGSRIWVSLSSRIGLGPDRKPVYDEGFILDITKRKLAEDLLRRSEQNYRLMFDSAPLAINVTRGTEITYANPSYLEMFGYSSLEELQALAPVVLFVPEQRAQIAQIAQRRGKGLSAPDSYEAECLRRDGTRFPVLIQFARAEFADGPASVAFITSLTESKRADAESREADLQFRTFVEQAPVAIAVTRDGTIEYSNQRVAEMFGLERPDELLGQPSYVLFAPHLREESRERTRRRARGVAVPAEYDSIGVRADGSQFPIHLALGTVQLRDGSADIAFISDASERQQADQMLEERAHFLEELLEAIPVPVHYKDRNLRYLGCNKAFAALFDLRREEIVGQTVFEIHPGELAARLDAINREFLAHPEQPIEDPVDHLLRDGTRRYVSTHKAIFSDVAGKPAGIVAIDFDMTEIRRAEQELDAIAVKLRLTLEGAINALSAVAEQRDPYTAGHQRRVAELACAIGSEPDLKEVRLESLRIAALLHDIGKVTVPSEILSKPGRLGDLEMQMIRTHATVGADTVALIGFEGVVAEIVRQHHERLDGSGYPAGLRGPDILFEARASRRRCDRGDGQPPALPSRSAYGGGPERDREGLGCPL